MINGVNREEYERWLAHTYLHVFTTEDLIQELRRRGLCLQTEKSSSTGPGELTTWSAQCQVSLPDSKE